MQTRLIVGLLVSACLNWTLFAQGAGEYRLKAAFVFSCMKFVEWPQQAFKLPTDPLTVCILGKNPFGNMLLEAVEGRTIGDHPILVRAVSGLSATAGCHVLFVSASERKNFTSILDATGGRGILTIGDVDPFAAVGGVIDLKLEGGKIHLRINRSAAEEQHLHLSSKMLGLAEIVGPAK